MKKRIFLGGFLTVLALLLIPMAAEAKEKKTDKGIPVTSKYFSDKRILKKAKRYDKDQDGYLSPEEIAKVKYLIWTTNAVDLSQLKYFTNLRTLCVEVKDMSRYNGKTLDFTIFPKMEHISITLDYKKPTISLPDVKVKVSGLEHLSSVGIYCRCAEKNGKKLRTQFVDTVDLRNLPSLTNVYMDGVKELIFDDDNGVEKIEVKNITKAPYGQLAKLEQLEWLLLWSDDPKFTEADVSANHFLISLNVRGASLKKVTTAGAEALERLGVKSSLLREIDLTQNPKLKELNLICPNLRSLDLTKNPKLAWMYVSLKRLEALDLTKNSRLRRLRIKADQLKALDMSKNKMLKELDIVSGGLTELNIENSELLEYLDLSAARLTELDLSGNHLLSLVSIRNTGLKALDLSAQVRIWALSMINNKALAKVTLPQKLVLASLSIVDTPWQADLSEFENLDRLELGGAIGALKAGGLPSDVEELTLADISLKTVDLSELERLRRLTLRGNIGVSKLKDLPTNIERLTVENTQIKSVDLSHNGNLDDFRFRGNKKAEKLDLRRNVDLCFIDVSDNALKTLNLGKKKRLSILDCKNNKLTTLDLSGVPKSCSVYCDKSVKVKGFKGKVNRN